MSGSRNSASGICQPDLRGLPHAPIPDRRADGGVLHHFHGTPRNDVSCDLSSAGLRRSIPSSGLTFAAKKDVTREDASDLRQEKMGPSFLWDDRGGGNNIGSHTPLDSRFRGNDNESWFRLPLIQSGEAPGSSHMAGVDKFFPFWATFN